MMTRNLPEDIVADILLNLPVKSLSRFICACKAWHALIKGNIFIQEHLHRSTEDLLVVYNHDAKRDKLRLKFLTNEFMSIGEPNFSPETEFYGSANGLFCLYDYNLGTIVLRNVAIRETRVLPLPPNGHAEHQWYGRRFGWDERMNDYKLIIFSRVDPPEFYLPFTEERVDIYSMRNDSWTHFEGNVPFYNLDVSCNLKCLDGVFYWFQDRHETGRLLSFHIADEVFEEIVLPDFLSGGVAYAFTTALDKYDDHLAIIQGDQTYDENCFDIWVLRQSCWSKVLTVGPFTNIYWSLRFGMHGEVLFQARYDPNNTTRILIYNPQSQQLTDPGFHGSGFLLLPYKESLVSARRMPQDVINIADLSI